MKYTDFLKLRQPEFGDPANILDISENMGALDASAKGVDTALKELQDGSLSREEFGQFVTDLAAEMVKYGNAGMTNVDNVKAALDWVYASLANKVEKESPAKYDFLFLKGEVLVGPCKFWKNALNQVFYTMYFERSQGFAVQDTAATFPPGFRPAETEFFTHHPSNISTGAKSVGVSGYITSEGEIKLTFFSDATYNRTRFEGWFQI